MIKFSLVMIWLCAVCVRQTGGFGHGKKASKCAKTPDTWEKVNEAIKECQEDVKLNFIEDAFYSNDWDGPIFDDDGHFPFSDGHEHHSPIIDSSTIYDHKPHIIEHHSHDHQSHVYNDAPINLDHGKPIYDHHPQIHDHHPEIHDHHPQILDHHPQIHDQLKIQDDHVPIHDSAKNEHYPILLSFETLAQRPHEHSSKPHHSPEVLHIEEPQLKHPQPFSHSTHPHRTKNNVHIHPAHHVGHTISMSDGPFEQGHYIDFNDFRKKRHVGDHERIHSSTATYHDKRIAGCILQCIYKKNHAIDTLGWPTLDGLVSFYSEGVNEHAYFMATLRAVDYCLKGSSAKYHVNRRSTPEKGQTCDVAFDVFDCVSDQITEYCSDHHSD